MTVTVLVPSWRRSHLLPRLIGSLRLQEFLPEEIVVAGRTDDEQTKDVVDAAGDSEGPAVRWIPVDRPGFLAPIQTAMNYIRTEIVAIIDDDATPDTSWLERLRLPFADPKVACVGGRVIEPGKQPLRISRRAGQVTWFGQYVGQIGHLSPPSLLEVHSVMEGNCAWQTDVLRSLEFEPIFDLDDALNYGLDLCLQAKSRGYRIIYAPEATVTHQTARPYALDDLQWRLDRAFVSGRNVTYIGLRRYEPFRRAIFLPWWVLVGERQSYGLIKAAWDFPRSPRATALLLLASMRGRKQGLRFWLDYQRIARQPLSE